MHIEHCSENYIVQITVQSSWYGKAGIQNGNEEDNKNADYPSHSTHSHCSYVCFCTLAFPYHEYLTARSAFWHILSTNDLITNALWCYFPLTWLLPMLKTKDICFNISWVLGLSTNAYSLRTLSSLSQSAISQLSLWSCFLPQCRSTRCG